MDKPTFYAVRDALKERVKELVVDSHERIAVEFHAKDTICGQVYGREDKLSAFAASQDVMIFVAGRASSNGKVLYEIARATNPRTYFIEHIEELQAEWFQDAENIGISGATSTPQWLMENVKTHIEQTFSQSVLAE
jgi:4-hydroxy-3-methylbut-2-enyl diphosphate reductase